MSTATQETPATETPAPFSFSDSASAFYGDKTPDTSKSSETPSPEQTGTPATPQASAASPEPEKTEQPKGKAESDAKGAAESKADDEKGHAAAARRLGGEVKDLKTANATLAEQVKVLQAKLDGTYEEPAKPTEAQIAAQENFKGRERASKPLAEAQYGAERVQKEVYDVDSDYTKLIQDKPWHHIRVVQSDQPAVAAMRALDLDRFEQKYGADPAQWHKKLEDELRPIILAELTKKAEIPLTGTPAPSVTESRATSSPERTPRGKSDADVFYGKG